MTPQQYSRDLMQVIRQQWEQLSEAQSLIDKLIDNCARDMTNPQCNRTQLLAQFQQLSEARNLIDKLIDNCMKEIDESGYAEAMMEIGCSVCNRPIEHNEPHITRGPGFHICLKADCDDFATKSPF